MARRRRGRRLVDVSLLVYRVLLYAYPARLRREFGAEMAQVFRENCVQAYCHRGRRGLTRAWRDTLGDLLVSVPREHMEGLRRPTHRRFRLAPHVRRGLGMPRRPLHALDLGVAWHSARRTIMNERNGGPQRLRWFWRRLRPRSWHDRDRFDKFTRRVRRVLQLAQEEAQRHNHNYIGTEHLLLGLLRESDGVAAIVLTGLGVTLEGVRQGVEFIIGRGDQVVMGEVGLTPRSKKVIELAVDESRRMGHHYIGTEHLLLGLVREGEGIAADVLERQGLSLARVREETLRVLGERGADPDANGEGNVPS